MSLYKCDVCDKIFTEKRNLLIHEKSTHGEKNSFTCELCNKVYGRTNDLHRHKASRHFKSTKVQFSKCKKTFTRSDNLKRHKCKLDQETKYSPDSNEAPSNDVTIEQPTDKILVNTFAGEACFVDKPPVKKGCLKESSTNRVPDERQKSLNINNPYKDNKEDKIEQAMESVSEIRTLMQKFWTSIKTFTKRRKVQNIFNFFYDRDFNPFRDTGSYVTHKCFFQLKSS